MNAGCNEAFTTHQSYQNDCLTAILNRFELQCKNNSLQVSTERWTVKRFRLSCSACCCLTGRKTSLFAPKPTKST